jgi:hypothetical protein
MPAISRSAVIYLAPAEVIFVSSEQSFVSREVSFVSREVSFVSREVSFVALVLKSASPEQNFDATEQIRAGS